PHSSELTSRPSHRHRVGLVRIDAELLERLGDHLGLDLAVGGQRGQRRMRDPVRVDLEEVAQRFAGVAAAVAVAAERGEAAPPGMNARTWSTTPRTYSLAATTGPSCLSRHCVTWGAFVSFAPGCSRLKRSQSKPSRDSSLK